MKRITTLLVVMAMVFGLTGSAQAYTFKTLDIPGADFTFINGINDSGDVVGYSYYMDGNVYHSFKWAPPYDGSSYTTLDIPGASETRAHGINDLGDVVGWYEDGSGGHGFKWAEPYEDSTYTTLDYYDDDYVIGNPDITSTYANGINNSGAIVGSYHHVSGWNQGFAYNGSTYTTLEMDESWGWGAYVNGANGINDSGYIVGNYYDGSGGHHGFVLYGTYTKLTILADEDATANANARSINNSGDIVGSYYDNGSNHGFKWAEPYDDGMHTTVDHPDTVGGSVYSETVTVDINDSGYIVGTYYISGTSTRHGFIACEDENDPVCETPGLTAIIEPVQAVENTQTNDLVAVKDMVLRVYALLPKGTDPAEAIVDLEIDGSNSVRIEGTIFPEDKIFTEDELLDAKDSLNFYITGDWDLDNLLTPGVHSFTVLISPKTPDKFEQELINKDFIFVQSVGFNLLSIPVMLLDSTGAWISPDEDLVGKAETMLKDVYPVDEDDVTLKVWEEIGIPEPVITNRIDTVAEMKIMVLIIDNIMREQAMLTPGENNTFGAAVVPSLVDGACSVLNKDGGCLAGYTYPDVKGVVVTRDMHDGIPIIASTLAHEVGHQLGFGDEYAGGLVSANNPPPTIPSEEGTNSGKYVKYSMYAFDVNQFVEGRKAVFSSSEGNIFGYMGSGDDLNSWTGNAEYEFLFNKFTSTSASTQSLPPFVVEKSNVTMAESHVSRDVIYVSGTVNKDGTVSLRPFVIANSDLTLSALTGSGYNIQFHDGQGSQLGIVDFGLTFQMEVFGETEASMEDIDETPFSILSELPPGTDSVSIWEDTVKLVEITRSANAPAVSITSITFPDPNTPSAYTTWSGSDADGDPLTYSVLYSYDGIDIKLIASSISDNEVTFNLITDDSLPPSPDAYVRVIVNDGFNNSEDQELLSTVCLYSISPTGVSFPSESGIGSLSVTTNDGCEWTAVSNNNDWLSITSDDSGIGNGTVSYSVSTNTSTSSRSGTLTIEGETFTVEQDGATDGGEDEGDDDGGGDGGGGGGGGGGDTVVEVSDCELSVSPEDISFAAEGGAGSVSVTSVSENPDDECNWIATSNSGWIIINSGSSGSGGGTVEYTVSENTGESSRTHFIAITGDNGVTVEFTVSQDGATDDDDDGGGGGGGNEDQCAYSLSSTEESFTADSGTGSLNVTTDDGCEWTAVSNNSWITITSGNSGAGSGTVEYSVLENSDSDPRTGTMTIAGETCTVTQSEGGGGGGIGNPLPDIQANGSDGPVVLQKGEMLSVAVSLNPGERNGEDADWWIYATTPLFQTYWYTLDSGWVPSDTPIRVHGGPLFSLAPYTIVERSALPIGNYVINFEVDNNMDNFRDGTWTDSVEVTIE